MIFNEEHAKYIKEKKYGHIQLPDGTKIINRIISHSEDTEKNSKQFIESFGEKTPVTIENLGVNFFVQSEISTCRWGCAKGDHVAEYLIGKGLNSSVCSLRLLGYYDESLVLSRGIGEIANLLCLFAHDPSSFSKWKKMTKKERQKHYRPSQVRVKIQSMQISDKNDDTEFCPIDDARYKALSEGITHATPDSRPQSFNFHFTPVIGGYFQHIGALTALHELALPSAVVTLYGGLITQNNQLLRQLCFDVACKSLLNLGNMHILNLKENIFKLRK